MKLLATGGTIASVASPHGRIVGASGEALVEAAGKVWPLPAVSIVNTRSLISSALTREHVEELHDLCGSEPVVITHGTDALEETAIALALLRPADAPPVVLTGAQRPFDDPSPDGPRNLAAAISWAASDQARGTGVTVVFGDTVLPAIGVKKMHTLSLTGFGAPGRGPIAVVDDAGLRKFAHPVLPRQLAARAPDLSNVHVVTSHLGASTEVLEHILSIPRVGVVVEAMGAGNTAPHVTTRLVEALEAGVPVLVTSRTGAGATAGLYAGGGADLARAGAIFAGDLSTAQARWALGAALAHGDSWREEITSWLVEAGCVPRVEWK